MQRFPALFVAFVSLLGVLSLLGPSLADEGEDDSGPAAADSGALFPEELGPLPIEVVPGFLASLSAQTCNSCHGEIHDQWATSGHASAASNASYLAAHRAMGAPVLCDECHRPLLQQRPRLPRGPGGGAKSQVDNPAYDPILALEGVTCVVCHLRGEAIVGPRELLPGQSPHPVRADAGLSGPGACAFCHQLQVPGAEEHPFIDTVGEWLRSPQGQADIDCQQCHMPRVSGVIAGSRYAAFSSHEMTGGRSPAAMARALLLKVQLKSTSVQRGESFRASAALSNIGAGHSVPTGDPGHRLELSFDVESSSGKRPRGVKRSLISMGREMQPEAPFRQLRDDRLGPGETKTLDYSFSPHKKNSPGSYTLVVAVDWWSVDSVRAEEIGLSEEEAKVRILERRIPIEIN